MDKKILLVDDDSDFRSAVRLALEHAGYVCLEAGSGREGLRMAFSENPDLILLDVMMEDISSGFRFIRTWRRLEGRYARSVTPVLFLTSIQKKLNREFQQRIQSYFKSRVEFIDKPVRTEALLDRVKKEISR